MMKKHITTPVMRDISASLKQNSTITFLDKSSQKLTHAQLLILAPFITFCKQWLQIKKKYIELCTIKIHGKLKKIFS